MGDVISEYQNWKQQGEELRVKAKQAMESRFRELLSEAVRIAEEYRADFGLPLKPQSPVTAFRYKASARAKAKKTSKVAERADRNQPRIETPGPKPNPKLTTLQKRLATTKKKLDDAKATGKPTKVLEDRLYEIEDEFRLSGQALPARR
jgi:hypothetical protein